MCTRARAYLACRMLLVMGCKCLAHNADFSCARTRLQKQPREGWIAMVTVLSRMVACLLIFEIGACAGVIACNSSTTGPTSSCTGTADVCCQDYQSGAFKGCCYVGSTCCGAGCLPDGYTSCSSCLPDSSGQICPPQGPVCCKGAMAGRCCFKDLPICCDDGLHCGSASTPCPKPGSQVVDNQLGLHALDMEFMKLLTS